tara:strand:+ start:1397 stop:1663 length:267 start_codon:yes stop_codon:yes gene_type:complete
MSCCKDNLLLYLKIEDHQKSDKLFLEATKKTLTTSLGFAEEQSNQAINYAAKHGKCLILEGTMSEIGKITTIFAKDHISAVVETKSMK